MPMLMVAVTVSPSAISSGSCMTSARSSSARPTASSGVVSGRMSMNSSPPYRPKVSLARTESATSPAIWRRTASPELCP